MAKFLSCSHSKWFIFLFGSPLVSPDCSVWTGCHRVPWGLRAGANYSNAKLFTRMIFSWCLYIFFLPKAPREAINKAGQPVFVSFVSGLWHQYHMEHTSVTWADCILWRNRNILPWPKIKPFGWLSKHSCVQNGTRVELLYYILLKKIK